MTAPFKRPVCEWCGQKAPHPSTPTARLPTRADHESVVEELAGRRAEVAALKTERDRLRDALAAAALPLEVLAAVECDDAGTALSPEVKSAVMVAAGKLRAALGGTTHETRGPTLGKSAVDSRLHGKHGESAGSPCGGSIPPPRTYYGGAP